MKQHVVISEEVIEKQVLKSGYETEKGIRRTKEREEGSSIRRRDHAKEYYEQKRVATKPIALKDLFKKRSLIPGAPESEVRRVLLYGNPGSGKTCITKVFAYKWALREMAQEFDTVYVVPVRVLNSTEHKGQQWARIEAVISRICYSERDCAADCEDLVAQIQHDLDSPSTLLMVDGLDEANDHARELVSKIWDRSCKMLLLSRPYNMRNVETRVDIQVECLGFDDQQLRDYIESELPEDEAPRLIRSLESSDAMWEMAHIPVTAHILCSLSKEHGSAFEEGKRASTFQVYNDMANYVWKRFEEKSMAKNVQKSELFGDLEKVAFEALRNGAILIHERFVMEHATTKNAARTFKESGLLLLVLEGQEYQFPHLTFQEYFAGRHIARSLKQKASDEAARVLDFIQEGKYNEKHALALSFAMHAFARGQSRNALKEMLSIVDEQPVEVLGIQHFFLRMRVLEATMEEAEGADLETIARDERAIELSETARFLLERTIDNVLIREIVIEKLEKCFCVLDRFPKILNGIINETKTLLAKSQDLTWKERAKINAVLKLAKHSPKHIGDIGSFLQLDTRILKWHRTCDGMKRLQDIAKEIPQLTRDLLPVLQKGCIDKDSDVRKSGMEAIGKIAEAAPRFTSDLLPMLQKGCLDEVFRVHYGAMSTVGRIAKVAPQFADDLLSMLEKGCIDESSDVRESAMLAIHNIAETAPHLSGKVLPMLRKGFIDEHPDVRQSALFSSGKIAAVAPHISDELLLVLRKGFIDEHPIVRESAVGAIMDIVGVAPFLLDDLLPMVRKGWIDESSNVRNWAMCAISCIAKAAPQCSGDLLSMLEKGCIDESSDVRGRAMEAIGSITNAAAHLSGDLLPLLKKGCIDEASGVHEAADKALKGINVSKNMLSSVFLTTAYERDISLLLIRDAFTLKSSSESETVSLLLHATSSEEIGQWDKKDLNIFVTNLKQGFDESFPGLSDSLNKRLT